jgi:hypothetical protein
MLLRDCVQSPQKPDERGQGRSRSLVRMRPGRVPVGRIQEGLHQERESDGLEFTDVCGGSGGSVCAWLSYTVG